MNARPGGISRRSRLQNHFVRWARAAHGLFGGVSNSELFYQAMFYEAARALDLSLPPLYPVRGAANYSLLYVLLRGLANRRLRVLEIGAGQSSLLLDCMGCDVVTIEPDPDWASLIAARVRHPVLYAPMSARETHGRLDSAFDVQLDGVFDVVLVDSPHGRGRRSRWASLDILDRSLADEFLVIFDDAQRKGEMDTVSEFIRSRPAARHRYIYARDSQCLVFTKGFAEAAVY